MWNMSFKTYINNEVKEEGFETSIAHDINHVIQEIDTMFDFSNVDKVEIKINKINLTK